MEHPIESPAGAVEQVARELGTAFNARDPVALAALYTEDAVLMPPNEPPVRGNAAIRVWFDQALPRLGAIRLDPTSTRVERDLAVQVGTFQITLGTASGGAVEVGERAGKYVLILTRAEGRWAIFADLWNLDQPPG